MRESPGHSSSPHNAGKIPEKIGGEEPGCGGAYEEIQQESTAQCKAGPHNHQEEVTQDDQVGVLHQEQRNAGLDLEEGPKVTGS